MDNNRLLSKLAVESKVLGDAERKTAVYTLVHEDSITASTTQFASTVEFGKKSTIKVEVAYVTPEQQILLSLQVPQNSKIRDAIKQAKLFATIAEDLPVGIFGILRDLNYVLTDGDRVEIYRPLLIDPKLARIVRVKRDIKEKHLKKKQKSKVTAS